MNIENQNKIEKNDFKKKKNIKEVKINNFYESYSINPCYDQ